MHTTPQAIHYDLKSANVLVVVKINFPGWFFHGGKIQFPSMSARQASFTANANQSNESIIHARVAGTEVCGCQKGKKIDFYHLGN